MFELLVLSAVLAVSLAAALLYRRSQGKVKVSGGTFAMLPGMPDGVAHPVVFGGENCHLCKQTVAMLEREQVPFTYVDVAERVELAREMKVMSVPTTLIVDERGDVAGKVSGVPNVNELREALRGTR